MAQNERRLPLQHGEPRALPPAARPSRTAIDKTQQAELTLVLRSRGSDEEWRKLVAAATSGLPGGRRYLTPAELARDWAASPEDVEAVQKFARRERLKVVTTDAARRCVVVSASLERLERVFEVEFLAVQHPQGTFRSHRKTPKLPASMHPMIESIIGLENLPVAQPHAATAAPAQPTLNRQALLDWYDVPKDLDGKGQCVAVIDLAGGYHQRDLKQYFEQFGLAAPRVRKRGINGVKNDPAPPAMIRAFFGGYLNPGTPAAVLPPADAKRAQWTFEVTTDLAMVGTMAPGAEILYVHTSNNPQGQYHAVTSVITDRRNKPSVLSCSWGGLEPHQSRALMRSLDRWFEAAAVIGMTVCCSSGDAGNGTLIPGNPPDQFNVQFPACSPNVLACGGTTLHPEAGTEVAWRQNEFGHEIAGGGGFSDFFPMPSWQSAAGIDAAQWIPKGITSGSGRAIPDVAARANLERAYSVIVGGIDLPAGGTSAAAPLWAGLIALLNEGLKTRVGSLNLLLYQGALRNGLRDIVAGNTGVFRARKGWDACTGWGSPRGNALLQILRG